jgi:hypothetical protein
VRLAAQGDDFDPSADPQMQAFRAERKTAINTLNVRQSCDALRRVGGRRNASRRLAPCF